MLDEFANIGTIPDFEQKLSTMRKYEISCTIILQALSQLKTLYKDAWETLLGNCDTFIFLGGQEETTLKYVSERLGKETIKTQNSSKSYGRMGGNSQSYNVTGRELMTPDEVSRLDTSECIVFIRTTLPFHTKKYDYPRHTNYKYTGDADDNNLFFAHEQIHTQDAKELLKEAVCDDVNALYAEIDDSERVFYETTSAERHVGDDDIDTIQIITEERAKELQMTAENINSVLTVESTYSPFDEYSEPTEYEQETTGNTESLEK